MTQKPNYSNRHGTIKPGKAQKLHSRQFDKCPKCGAEVPVDVQQTLTDRALGIVAGKAGR